MGQVHYELFVRRKVGAQWTLEIATENRAHALQVAEDVLTQNRAVASRVTKETLDPSTGEYKSISIFTKGLVDGGKPKKEPTPLPPIDVPPIEEVPEAASVGVEPDDLPDAPPDDAASQVSAGNTYVDSFSL